MLEVMPKRRTLLFTVLGLVLLTSFVVAIPFFYVHLAPKSGTSLTASQEFPVTVDPKNKIIAEDPSVNALLSQKDSPLQAAVGSAGITFWNIVAWVAEAVSGASWYGPFAAVEGRSVTIPDGMRKEQVATLFGKALGWNDRQKKEFLTPIASSTLPLIEGSFSSGTYLVTPGMSPREVQSLVNARFHDEILSHYGTTTAAKVPLHDALTIASIIQRETLGTEDMRLISGILWNRLFVGMKLQVDATVQYVKAGNPSVATWWPKVVPSDMSRKSPYNTYLHPGLPPTPIATPSVAAVLAALNPLETDCLYYFNDTKGDIICSRTYEEHVKLLKQYYGRGR